MSRGRPVVRFERRQGARTESLDCCTYAICARAALTTLDLDRREAELAQPVPPQKRPELYKSQWMSR
jgi:hypothetical protein